MKMKTDFKYVIPTTPHTWKAQSPDHYASPSSKKNAGAIPSTPPPPIVAVVCNRTLAQSVACVFCRHVFSEFAVRSCVSCRHLVCDECWKAAEGAGCPACMSCPFVVEDAPIMVRIVLRSLDVVCPYCTLTLQTADIADHVEMVHLRPSLASPTTTETATPHTATVNSVRAKAPAPLLELDVLAMRSPKADAGLNAAVFENSLRSPASLCALQPISSSGGHYQQQVTSSGSQRRTIHKAGSSPRVGNNSAGSSPSKFASRSGNGISPTRAAAAVSPRRTIHQTLTSALGETAVTKAQQMHTSGRSVYRPHATDEDLPLRLPKK
eukprot:PhM_4_TR14110/c1_g4_i4/m.43020